MADRDKTSGNPDPPPVVEHAVIRESPENSELPDSLLTIGKSIITGSTAGIVIAQAVGAAVAAAVGIVAFPASVGIVTGAVLGALTNVLANERAKKEAKNPQTGPLEREGRKP